MRPRTDRQTDTHTDARVSTIHFASSTTQAKCNNDNNNNNNNGIYTTWDSIDGVLKI